MKALIGLAMFLLFCGTMIAFNGNPATSIAQASIHTHTQVIIPTFKY